MFTITDPTGDKLHNSFIQLFLMIVSVLDFGEAFLASARTWCPSTLSFSVPSCQDGIQTAR